MSTCICLVAHSFCFSINYFWKYQSIYGSKNRHRGLQKEPMSLDGAQLASISGILRSPGVALAASLNLRPLLEQTTFDSMACWRRHFLTTNALHGQPSRCHRKFCSEEILQPLHYFLGNYAAQRHNFLGYCAAARKFCRFPRQDKLRFFSPF